MTADSWQQSLEPAGKGETTFCMRIFEDHPEFKQSRLVALALALVTLGIYLPVCFYDFIYFDDPSYVADNPMVRAGLSWAGCKWAFLGWHASNWHPLTWLSLMVDSQLFGSNPGAYHLGNLVFHTVNTLLLFWLWRRLTGALWPSALVAALFAWHPLHVESVAWISERKDVLSTMFGLLALIAYVNFARSQPADAAGHSRCWWHYGAALILLALGLMAKPMLVTLPCVFLLLDYWPLKRLASGPVQFKQLALLVGEKIPFFLLVAASCVVTYLAQKGDAVVPLQRYPLGLRLENAGVAYINYILKIICPVNLGIIYPLPAQFHPGEVVLAGILIILISVFAWRLRRTNPSVLTGWLWYLGTLVPVIGIVQVGMQSMADRYSYLPSIGLFAAVAFGLAGMIRRQPSLRLPALCLAGLILTVCLALTERQLGYWKNTITLFSHTLAVARSSAEAHMILGVAYEHNGAQNLALHEYREALKQEPAISTLMAGGEKRPLAAHVALMLAEAAEQQGNVSNAIVHYREALQAEASLAGAHSHLAYLLYATGDIQKAIAHSQAAITLGSEDPLTYENFGTMLLETGRFDDAMKQYQQAAQLQPDSSRPFYLMGKAWLRHGQSHNAITNFQRALNLDAQDSQSLTALAQVLASDEIETNRNGSESLDLASQANALTGKTEPYVLDTLAMAYAETGDFQKARQALQMALNHAANTQTDLMETLKYHQRLFLADQPVRQAFTNSLPSIEAGR
jgi:Tfp pilus assembly protein PilF